jgi:hypothetical protein
MARAPARAEPDRLASYRRYADLVRRQEAAPAAGEPGAFRGLEDEASAFQAELMATLGGDERIQARLQARCPRVEHPSPAPAAASPQARCYPVAISDADAGVRVDLTF